MVYESVLSHRKEKHFNRLNLASGGGDVLVDL